MNNNVLFKDLLEQYKKSSLRYKLPIILGKNENGSSQFSDLSKLENILITGSTGSGKSVFNHNIISSLLSLYSSDKLRFVLIDMKLVEFNQYNGLPHLLAPVLPQKGDKAINKIFSGFEWLMMEKENRRNMSEEELDKYPYIVVVIDTFSDLIAAESDKFESIMMKLTDRSADLKMHTIICDSRTGKYVFTDHILKSFQTKIAFNTYDSEGSKLLLGVEGAEKLKGSGDMLFLPNSLNNPIRIQAPFISDEEITEIINTSK